MFDSITITGSGFAPNSQVCTFDQYVATASAPPAFYPRKVGCKTVLANGTFSLTDSFTGNPYYNPTGSGYVTVFVEDAWGN